MFFFSFTSGHPDYMCPAWPMLCFWFCDPHMFQLVVAILGIKCPNSGGSQEPSPLAFALSHASCFLLTDDRIERHSPFFLPFKLSMRYRSNSFLNYSS